MPRSGVERATSWDFPPGGRHCPLIIAHRGDVANAPENTLAAFQQALERGADGIELDVRLTRDSQLVVFHDRSLKRIGGMRRLVTNRIVMRKALAASANPPKTIKTDKLRSYLRPIREIFPEAKHIQSEGLASELDNNISERLQGAFRQRTKTLRGLDNLESGQRYLNGWVITYNFFKDHEGIGGRPPGELTHKVPPFEKWADVAKMPRVRHRRRNTRNSPASNPPVKVEAPKPRAIAS